MINKVDTMINKVKVPALSAVAAAVMVFATCKLVTDDDAGTRDVYSLRISSGEMSPWVEAESDGYVACPNPEAFAGTRVNGYVQRFQDRGLIEGFVQELNGGGDIWGSVYVMDFGTAEKANDMFVYQDAENTQKLAVSGIAQTVAGIDNSSGDGCIGYGHFDRFYIQVSLGGYADKTDSQKDAKTFLEHFQSKVKNM
ncbi:MAG: hypothetical protein JW863_07795 [Chitinispirillaceae bacterium]|nr:hypothetical protein [Chitinispirillaceae bacterium]